MIILGIASSVFFICLAVVICSYFDHKWPKPPGPPEPQYPYLNNCYTSDDYNTWKEYYRAWYANREAQKVSEL